MFYLLKDIIDTGQTIARYVIAREVASVKIATFVGQTRGTRC